MKDEIAKLLEKDGKEPRFIPQTFAMSPSQKALWNEACSFVKDRTGTKNNPLNKLAVERLMHLAREVLAQKERSA
jgi:hypothetical protein